MHRWNERSPSLVRGLLIVIIALLYWPVVGYDFGGWDDAMNVAANRRLLPPTLDSLRHYWTHFEADLYVPFTYTVWSAVAKVAYVPPPPGYVRTTLNPADFHLLNLGLHIIATLATFEVLRRCVESVWAAGAGALLFAVHPLQVEPVAWIAGMKDLLAGALSIIAIWQYLNAARGSRYHALCWTVGTIAFVLAMLSKPGAVITPAIAWILDVLILRSPIRRASLRALPWLLLAIPFAVIAKLAQPAESIGSVVPLHMRPLIAADAVTFYLWKLLWPANLAVDYGRTPQYVMRAGGLFLVWITPTLLIALAVWFARVRRNTFLLVGCAAFIVALLPVLGLIPFDFQAYSTVADHYMYLAMLGPSLVLAWLLDRVRSRALACIAGAIFLVLLVQSRLQLRHWRDAITIFEHTVRVNPTSWAAHNTLSFEYTRHGNYELALQHARDAVAANPNAVLARFSLAAALANTGRTNEAIEAYRDLINREPNHIAGRLQLATLLQEQGRINEATESLEAVLQIDPQNVLAKARLEMLANPPK